MSSKERSRRRRGSEGAYASVAQAYMEGTRRLIPAAIRELGSTESTMHRPVQLRGEELKEGPCALAQSGLGAGAGGGWGKER